MRPFILTCFGGIAAFALPVSAQETPPDLPRLLTMEEMAEARGGFTIAGLEVNLGADLRTYLDGELVMQTIVTWENDGPNSQRWVSDLLTPASASGLENGLLGNGSLAMNINGQEVFLANDGQTALMQQVDGGLQNLAFNTASGIDLRQEADISLAISNYQAFSDLMAPSILMSGLGEALSLTAVGATGN